MAKKNFDNLTHTDLVDIISNLKQVIGNYRRRLTILENNLRQMENISISLTAKTRHNRRLSQTPIIDSDDIITIDDTEESIKWD